MKLVFAGTPEVAVPALDALIASGRHEVAAVVTRPDAPAGRGRRLVASPVAERAEEAGIEVLKPAKPRDEEFLARLREIAPDCCPVVAYGALLPKVALDVPAHGWVNLHFSLLPAWRGAAPVQHSVMAGDEVTGASTFLIEEGLDSGPGLRGPSPRRSGPPTPAATCSPGSPSPVPGCSPPPWTASRTAPCRPCRSPPTASPSPRRSPSRTPRSTGRRPRCASTGWCAAARPRPAPGPSSAASGSSSSRSTPRARTAPTWRPGELSVGKNNVYVGHRSHAVELLWVQPQGKKPMRAADWARGVRIAHGELLGS